MRSPRRAPPRGRGDRGRPACSRWRDRACAPSRSCPGDGSGRVSSSSRRALRPTSSTSSRRPHLVGGLARRRRACRPGSRSPRVVRRRGTATTSTTDGLPSASNSSGTTPTAPGERTMSRRNVDPSGPRTRRPPRSRRAPGGRAGLRRRPERRRRRSRRRSTSPARLGTGEPARGRGDDRASAAAISSRNSGCGRSGRLLNSGWACVPTQYGWSAQLDELDEAVVGRRARAHEARASPRRAR